MSISSMSGSRGAAGNKIPKGYAAGSLQQFDPDQMQVYKNQFSYISPGSQLAQRAQGNDAGFAPFEDYAHRQFQEFSGQNASRFSGQGMGARKGSGFQNLQTQGAQDFASQLSMQRQGLQRQALSDLMGLSSNILGQRPQENFLIKKQQQQPWWSKLLGAGLPIAGAAVGGAFGGLPGASLGASLGSGISQGFQPTQW